MGVRICYVRFSVVEELCIEGCAADGADGVVVPCFHLGDFIEVEMEFVESDFLVHVGDVLDDGVCVELVSGLVAFGQIVRLVVGGVGMGVGRLELVVFG